MEVGNASDPERQTSTPREARQYLPDLTFTFAGHNFSIGPEDYIFDLEDYCISFIFANDRTPPGDHFALFGTAFLRKCYGVFDLGANSINFAEAKGTV